MTKASGERADRGTTSAARCARHLRDGAVGAARGGRSLADHAGGREARVARRAVGRRARGAELGLLSAMIAVGLALTYRANRIINFAQADLGIVPALLALLLILAKGWSIWFALPLGLLASGVLGALVELLFVRRFFTAPRLILTVATIGIAQILVAVSLFMPGWFGNLSSDRYPAFVDVDFTFGQVAFNGNDLAVFVIVPIVLIALAVFMRTQRDRRRAAGQRRERQPRAAARRAGEAPAHRGVDHLVGARLRRPVPAGRRRRREHRPGARPEVLLPALGAAVIGRMERMPTIVGAAVGLGIVDQSVRFAWNQDAYRDAVIAADHRRRGALRARPRPNRVGDGEMSSWQATRETRPIPAELRKVREVIAAQWVLAVLVLAGLAAIPVFMGQSRVLLAGTIGIFAMIGISLVVLTGWGGQVSLGQVAVVGLAGAAAGSVTTRYHWDLSLALLVGGVAGAIVMTAVGLPTLRARGLTFAVTTLALALVTSSYLLNPAVLLVVAAPKAGSSAPGSSGRSRSRARPATTCSSW